jgi:hypothetical protein
VAGTLRQGTAEPSEEGWLLSATQERAEVTFDVDAAGRRRCYALGFVLHAGSGVSLQLQLRRAAGSTSRPIDVHLEGAGTYAGVVEFDAHPDLISTASLRLRMSAGECLVHDLFLVSYG